MSDEQIRRAERAAAAGDLDAAKSAARGHCRRGEHKQTVMFTFEDPQKSSLPLKAVFSCRHCGIPMTPSWHRKKVITLSTRRDPYSPYGRLREQLRQERVRIPPGFAREFSRELSRHEWRAHHEEQDHAVDALAYALALNNRVPPKRKSHD